MSDLANTLCGLVELFGEMRLDYAVMGGFAVRVYGIPRPTYDVDFTLAIARDRLDELYRRVEEAGFTVPDAYRTGWVDNVAGMPVVKFRLHLAEQGIDIDVFLAESDYQREVLARRRRETLGPCDVWLVSPEDLVLLKLLAARPRDMADIGDVFFTQGQLDEVYLRRWADELGVRERLEEVLD